MGRIVKVKKGLAAFSRAGWASRQLPGLRGQKRVGFLSPASALGRGKWGWGRSSSCPREQTGGGGVPLAQPTFFDHPNSQALLKSAVLTTIPAPLVHWAVFIC